MKNFNRFTRRSVAIVLFALPSLAQQPLSPQPLMAANEGTPTLSLASPAVPVAQLRPETPSTSPSWYSAWPRPFAYGGMALSRGGYEPTGGIVGTGLNLESTRFLFWAEASADNLHKQDSNTGSDLDLKSRIFVTAPRGFFFGGGAQWSKLTTSLYSKQAWRPTFGGGKDLIREDFSMRAQVVYVLPGTDRLNASQGPEMSLWLPSPSRGRHWFYRQTLGLYEAHQTAVPGNPGTEYRFLTSFLDMTVMYRF